MARLNIEDRFFSDPRVDKIAKGIRKSAYDTDDLSKFAAIGFLTIVWHEMQSSQIIVASKEKIDFWTCEGVAELIIASGLGTVVDGGLMLSGNKQQIDALKAKHIKAKGAAATRWESDAPSIEKVKNRCSKHRKTRKAMLQACL